MISVLVAQASSLTPAQSEFFENKIRPVLAGECSECHSAKKQKGGLRLDWRDALLKGGDNGPAIVLGDAKRSLLITAITHERDDLKMPDKGVKLDDAVIKDFTAWVNMGAPDPRDSPPADNSSTASTWDATLAARRTWWSYQPVTKPGVPTPKNAAWSEHPVDRFLLTKMEERGLQPLSPAEPRVLVRRLHFALTGLPPKPEEVESFVKEAANDPRAALNGCLERLLASPHFGERWARHWMDLVRYAESHGSEGDPEIRDAWRYRDYLIRAFNADVSVDQLIREHIAGDLLPDPRLNRAEALNESIHGIASLRLNEHGFQPVDTLDDQVKTIENQIDVLSKAFQAQTVSCARCHDHKFDPISQRDFYALYGVLASTRPAQVQVDTPELLTKNRDALAKLKGEIKHKLVEAWLAAAQTVAKRLLPKPDADDVLTHRVRYLGRELGEIDRTAMAKLESSKSSANVSAVPLPQPIARWSFEGDARDSAGSLHGALQDGAVIRDGRLILDGNGAHVRTAPISRDLKEKTLEAWVALADLEQRGGGVITIESGKGSIFDSIVFAEKAPKKWVNGSNNFRRSKVLDGPDETASPGELVHVVVVYRADSSIAFYRNGIPYDEVYTPSGPESTIHRFNAIDAHILLGRRHTGGGRAFLAGEIDEARLYDRALSKDEITASFRAGPEGVSEAEIVHALTSDQRTRRESLKRELVAARAALESQQTKLSQVEWLSSALRDDSHPLHVWAKFGRLADAEFVNAWKEFVANQPRSSDSGYRIVWDLAKGDDAKWFRSGLQLPAGVSGAGEFALESAGDVVVSGIYPAGVYSHTLSQKHGGLFTSPRFKIETDSISVRALGGGGAAVRLIVDNYPLGINPIFPKAALDKDRPGWLRLDTNYRKGSWAYLEFATFDDLTRPVAPAKKLKPSDTPGRSFFGVERVAFHDHAEAPRETNAMTTRLLRGAAPKSALELAALYGALVKEAVQAWRVGKLTEEQRALLDAVVRHGLLPNTLGELPQVAPLLGEYRQLEEQVPVPRRSPGVIEALAFDASLMPRGDHTKPGELVPRGYLQVLGKAAFQGAAGVSPAAPSSSRKSQNFRRDAGSTLNSGRLELAHAIASPTNPLTARVMVNRIWHQLFGRGLVPTVDNFGRLGDKPTHPELLDFLAAKFVEDGWSMKQTIRFLVTSRAWQMGSEPSARAREVDPANELLSHFGVRRLEAEAVRDSLLAMSGELDATMFGKPVGIGDQKRRSIYLALRRNSLSPFLEVFDAPKPFTTQGKRDVTNVPAQSLALLNDPFVIHCADRWAKALATQVPGETAEGRIRRMFEASFARTPTTVELEQAQRYLGASPGDDAWRDLAQSLFNLKEYIYVR